jgi:hypothetical protein
MALCPIVVASVILLNVMAAPVQKHPDFSGTWTEDAARRITNAPPPPEGASMPALPPADIVIRHGAADVTIERKFMSQVIRYVYRLDGGESVNHNGANTLTTRSRWDGRTLVTEGTSYSVTSAGESSWQFKEVRSLDAKGEMVVETSNKDDATGKTLSLTQVWKRKS